MLARLIRPKPDEKRSGTVVHGPDFFGYIANAASSYGPLRHAAVWACVDVLASSASELPADVVRDGPNGSKLPVGPTPSLIAAPSGLVTADVWLYQVVWSMLVDGNTFGVVTAADAMGRPTSIETAHPDQVTERKVVDGVPQARVDGTVMRRWPYGDLWHVPGKMVVPGSPFGLSPVAYAAHLIDAAQQASEFGRRFFTEGGVPAAIIQSDDPDLDGDQAKEIKSAWRAATEGTREPAVLSGNLAFELLKVDPSNSQFIDLQRFIVEEVCRFFRVPPSMVYAATSGQNITYANVAQADLHYLKHSLDGYLVRLERALGALLPRPQQVRFNRNALLRSDTKARYEAYEIALRNKFSTVDEVRALEDKEPFGGDFSEPGVPAPAAPAPAPGGTPA